MQYDIATRPDYIRVYYWGNGDIDKRLSHTIQLITMSRIYKLHSFLIDTRDLDSIMEPVDFTALADFLIANELKQQSKIAILCGESKLRSKITRFDLKCMGINCDVFHDKESATKWLTNLEPLMAS